MAMLRPLLTIIALLHGAAASAEIYRWVDEDGRVHFSDRRNPGSEKLEPKISHSAKTEPVSQLGPDSPEALFLGPYSALEILSPAANETLTQETNSVSVSLLIDPPLIQGHQLTLLLDGVALSVAEAATQFKLSGADFGSHQMQLRIHGIDGRTVAQTPPRAFHLRQPVLPGQLP